MAYASASDVEVELGRPAASTAETAQWEAWLERVERAVRRRFVREGYDLDDQIALDIPSEEDLIDVEVAAVIRKVQNPTWGEDSTTMSVDDASVTRRRRGNSTVDPLWPLGDEWASLLPAAANRPRAFSIMPSHDS